MFLSKTVRAICIAFSFIFFSSTGSITPTRAITFLICPKSEGSHIQPNSKELTILLLLNQSESDGDNSDDSI